MGSGIACHFANAGFHVVMLDMASDGNTPQARSIIASTALDKAVKSSPAPLYSKDFKSRIKVGNFEDDLNLLKNCDWILEVVKEDIAIKRIIFEKVETVRKPGTLITSNTSGIPIKMMAEGEVRTLTGISVVHIFSTLHAILLCSKLFLVRQLALK